MKPSYWSTPSAAPGPEKVDRNPIFTGAAAADPHNRAVNSIHLALRMVKLLKEVWKSTKMPWSGVLAFCLGKPIDRAAHVDACGIRNDVDELALARG